MRRSTFLCPKPSIVGCTLSPNEILSTLNDFIVGQTKAKRAVAVALRNRWRRRNIKDTELQSSIVPKNILMVGPTGVGKTEISRRMAKLTDAPFLKVEATKYTEVGFKGKDVDSIIEDLYTVAKSCARKQLEKGLDAEADATVATAIIRLLMEKRALLEPDAKALLDSGAAEDIDVSFDLTVFEEPRSRKLGEMQRDGISFDLLSADESSHKPIIKKPVTMKVKDARKSLKEEELRRLVSQQAVEQLALQLTEEEGIVFIDEIDKVIVNPSHRSKDMSAEGVQQDLLPIIEGTTVTTKDNVAIKTDSILFICSGAFHMVKPADMIAELQGRLPIRVELEALTEADFYHILTTPKYNLLRQHQAMLRAEAINLTFDDDAVREIAKAAKDINHNAQNIGARRLYTVLEHVMESYSYEVEKYRGTTVQLTKASVEAAVSIFRAKADLAKYLL